MWVLVPVLALAASPFQAPAAKPSADARRAGHERMVARLAEQAERDDVSDFFVGQGELPARRTALAELPPGKQPKKRMDLLIKIGFDELRLGNTEAAIAAYQEAVGLLPSLPEVPDPDPRFQLALAWMRLGETQNCVAHHTSESCILPIGKGGVHPQQEGSRKAIEVLKDLLAAKHNDPAARWLLNLAYMTVGEYPDGVPADALIPPSAFQSDEAFPRFVDVAPELGLNQPTLAGGVIVDDFDDDGVLDIVASAMDMHAQLRFNQGHRGGTFTERTAEAGLTGITGGLYITQTDFDNDGRLDIFVPRGAWRNENGRVPCSLLHNEGGGTFLDVTFAAGLAEVSYPTQAAAWADYDNDGDLDLFLGNETSQRLDAPSQLYRNEGNGTFVDVAARAGVLNGRYTKGASWGDYDGDRWPDLYVSNYGQANRLYHNRGDGTFEDVAEKLGVTAPERSFPCWFWDYDNDGALDLYVATYSPMLKPFVRDLLGGEVSVELARLYKGDGHGGFTDVARESGLDDVTVTMGSNFGDLDNDGFLDMYLGTGFPEYEGLVPNKMYWNRGGKRFADVTTNAGVGHLQKGHAVAFADLDGDGDQDVFAKMGGAFKGDVFGAAVFQNPGFGNHWIGLKLVGVQSNRAAIGARIRCEIHEAGQGSTAARSVYKHVNCGGSFGANPLRQTLGLGQATKVDVLEVYWPTSKRTQTFRDVPADAQYRITEGRDELERFE